MLRQLVSKIRWNRTKSNPSSGPVMSDFSIGSQQMDVSIAPLQPSSVIIKKPDNAEVFREAVDKLVEKLERINDNLSAQVGQNERLVERMNALPAVVEEQREAFAQVAEQLRQKVARDERVADELIGIHEKVAQSAEVDAKMCENFGLFSETLRKLDNDTLCQTEWLQQMSQTFSANERYIKETIARQQVRFYWIFGVSLGVCLFVIIALIVGIALMRG